MAKFMAKFWQGLAGLWQNCSKAVAELWQRDSEVMVELCLALILYGCVEQMHGCVEQMHIISNYPRVPKVQKFLHFWDFSTVGPLGTVEGKTVRFNTKLNGQGHICECKPPQAPHRQEHSFFSLNTPSDATPAPANLELELAKLTAVLPQTFFYSSQSLVHWMN